LSITYKNNFYNIHIDKIIYPGIGIGVLDHFQVEVPNSLPGDHVTLKIIKQYKTHLVGKITQYIQKSPLRTQELCTHFNDCGGCQILDIAYQDQLLLKQNCLEAYFKDYLPNEKISKIIGVNHVLFYRNKMEFAFGQNENTPYLGLKKRGHFDQVIPLEDCLLQDPLTPHILKFTNQYFKSHTLTAWNYHTHTGELRYLSIRQSKTQSEFMVSLVCSNDKALSIYKEFSQQLMQEFPQITSFFLVINPEIGDTAQGKTLKLFSGKGYLQEILGDLKFQISPTAFFQTNTKQAYVLYSQILKIADLKPTDIIFDLYCGTGTIGLFLAKSVANVIGIEENPASIEDAKQNALLNQITNVEFEAQNVKNFLKFDPRQADCIIVDPPRDGLIPKALKRIIEKNPKKIIYVSCNLKTLCRDLLEFQKEGYQFSMIQPVDMFPNTWHIEMIVKLEKIS